MHLQLTDILDIGTKHSVANRQETKECDHGRIHAGFMLDPRPGDPEDQTDDEAIKLKLNLREEVKGSVRGDTSVKYDCRDCRDPDESMYNATGSGHVTVRPTA